MNDILNYAKTMRSKFTERPFCDVDSLILCQISNLQLQNICDNEKTITIRKLAYEFDDNTLYRNTWVPKKTRILLHLLAENPRFCNIRLCLYCDIYDEKREMQFAAVTFLLDDISYIAFRGTDTTFIGWKEDFNMAHTFPVPAQTAGYAYLSSVAPKLTHKIFLGGHSKGGNIALFAAYKAKDPLFSRIEAVYCHDSPGFRDILRDEKYSRLKSKMFRTIPRSSLVGMILWHQGMYTVVKNHYPGFLQHNPFTWKIKNGAFCTATCISRYAMFRNRVLNRWIQGLSLEHRKLFVDTIFDGMLVTNATTFSEFSRGFHHRIAATIRWIRNLDHQNRNMVWRMIKSLIVEPYRMLHT